MNIGETIYKLRSEKNMSQGDLADMLDVSRQSVSKWETNQSVPDLDKIIKLSKIFDVTLDEFVLGEKQGDTVDTCMQTEQKEPEKIVIIKETVAEATKGQRIAGIILLCMSFMVFLLVGLMGQILEGMVFALPFLICGIICMTVKRNAGLWCAWAIYLLLEAWSSWVIGINSWTGMLRMLVYGGTLPVGGFVSLAFLIYVLILIIITVIRFMDMPIKASNVMLGLIIAGWVMLVLMSPLQIMIYKIVAGIHISIYALIIKLFDILEMVMFVTLLTCTIRFIRFGRKRKDI